MFGSYARPSVGVLYLSFALSFAGACKKAPPPSETAPTGVSQEDLKRVVRENRPAMEKCHDAALAKNPNAPGKVELVFSILRDGSVDPKTLGLAGEGKEPELARCVLDVVVKLKFPPATAVTDVQLPIDLGKRADAGAAGPADAGAADAGAK